MLGSSCELDYSTIIHTQFEPFNPPSEERMPSLGGVAKDEREDTSDHNKGR